MIRKPGNLPDGTLSPTGKGEGTWSRLPETRDVLSDAGDLVSSNGRFE
jgi:hypothetical protein